MDIRNHTYNFFDDIINIKNFGPNKIKIDENSYKKFLIYYIRYLTIKDSKYIKITSLNSLYLIANKVIWFFEEINENKYLTLIPRKKKKYEEQENKIKDLSKCITKNSDDYEEKYLILKVNSNDELPLNKIFSMIIDVRDIFYENYKYYPQAIHL